ncbi:MULTISPECIES: hypothetical protein [Pseudomonas]|uniref:hypothetical protein n=1 Tax=Pseudomonas TaxID=286 RepID=UPI0012E36D80|nr:MULTISPECIES: hypothetical protein [Pseudomonas]WHS54041.1 hypothetical protein QLH64_27635 [Pseudomonas brassicacearum]
MNTFYHYVNWFGVTNFQALAFETTPEPGVLSVTYSLTKGFVATEGFVGAIVPELFATFTKRPVALCAAL